MQKTTKASEVSYIARYNKEVNDWSSYQPISATARGVDAAQTGLGGSGSLVKKKKLAPAPPKEMARAYSVLPPPNRTGGPTVPAVRAEKTDKKTSPADVGERQSSSHSRRVGDDDGDDEKDSAAAPLPDPSSTSETDAKPSAVDDANHQAAALRLRRELDHLNHRAESEMQAKDQEIARLKEQVARLKEKATNQSVELKDCLRALDEVKRESAAEVQMCRREGALAERRVSSMQARLGAAAANSERVFASANAQLEALRGERHALAEAMAEIASAVVGGAGGTREELAVDAEAAVAEGSDPLPKRTDSWLQYSYNAEGGRHGGRPGHDGEKAVRALVASVNRLHRRCRDALDSERRQRGLARELEGALNGMTAEYKAVEDATMTLFDHAVTVQQLCGIVGFAPSKVEKGIAGRLNQVAHILERVHGAFEEHKAERTKMQSQIIELDFYSKLHLKLLEQAKTKTGASDKLLVVDDATDVAPALEEAAPKEVGLGSAALEEAGPGKVAIEEAGKEI